MTDRALLEQILANQSTILAALQRGGLIQTERQEVVQELTEARRLAAILREHGPSAYKAEMKKRKLLKRRSA